VIAIFWQRVAHQYGYVGFSLPLVVLDLLYPAIVRRQAI
jgi:hypothetical protein